MGDDRDRDACEACFEAHGNDRSGFARAVVEIGLAVLVAGGLVGCNSLTDTYNTQTQLGSTPVLLTTADLRTISQRPDPMDGRPIVCTEPPPDVAKALSTAFAFKASGNAANSAGGSVGANNSTAEQLAELAGRVPGLLALRDILFRACEAYANGMIGDTTYALVTSRYGELLVTLILGDAITPQSRAAPTILGGLNLTIPADGSGSSPTGGKGSATTPSNSGSTPAKQEGADAGGLYEANAPRLLVNNRSSTAMVRAIAGRTGPSGDGAVQLASLAPIFVAAGNASGAAVGASGAQQVSPNLQPQATQRPAPRPAAQTQPSQQSASRPAAQTQPAQQSSTKTNSPGADTGMSAAQALEEMQQNYLSIGVLQPILVACINEYDPTRRGAYSIQTNPGPPPSSTLVPLNHNPVLPLASCATYISEAVNAEIKLQTATAVATAYTKTGLKPSVSMLQQLLK